MLDRDHEVMIDPRRVQGSGHFCPACGDKVEGRPKYCPSCGQLLNWRIVQELYREYWLTCSQEDVEGGWCQYYLRACHGSTDCDLIANSPFSEHAGNLTVKERRQSVEKVLNSFNWEEQRLNINYKEAKARKEVKVVG